MTRFTTPVKVVRGRGKSNGGKIGYMVGTLADQHPKVTKVYVKFPGEPYPKDLRVISIKNLSEISDSDRVLL